MQFYTNVKTVGNKIAVRGIENGRRFSRKLDYNPTFYLPSKEKTKFTTLIGNGYLTPFSPGNISECRDFLERYRDVTNFDIFGNPKYEYAWISEHFSEQMPFDSSLLYEANIDIETESDNGFPDIEKADEPILSITIESKHKYVVFGMGDYVPHMDSVTYIKCTNEIDLLQKFIAFWTSDYPDTVTGYNISLFDIPYLLHRITRVLGDKAAKSLSPWHKLKQRKVIIMGRENSTYELVGINQLDWLELFKKFSPIFAQEQYSLDFIARTLIGESKLKYENVPGHRLHKVNYQKFIEYNIHDTTLVRKMDDKEKLLELAYLLAADAHVNPGDVFSQVRMWTQIIEDALYRSNKAVSAIRESFEKEPYAGGFVKDPKEGWWKWLASFDLTSLYPHLIMQWNISPDMLINASEYTQEMHDILAQGVSVETLLNKQIDTSKLKELGVTLTPNGQFFRIQEQGFVSKIISDMFDARASFKRQMLDGEKQIEINKAAGKSTKELEYLVTKFNNRQQTKKVCLNSYYGATGNEYFFLYDVRLASAVTLSGQFVIQWAERYVNKYINKALGTQNVDYVIAADTDSLYITLDSLIKRVFDTEPSPEQGIEFLDKVCKEKIQPVIHDAFKELAEYLNVYQQKMHMKRESLVDKAIWTGKKHYVLNVWDQEGVRYTEPKIKVKGLEMVRSSTPNICRKKMKESLKIILNGTEKDVQSFISDFKKEFMDSKPVEVASPRSCNGMEKYSNIRTIVEKGTPMQVCGALYYNHLLEKHNVTSRYPIIREGDKIKFINLIEPNPAKTHVISFHDEIPEEFGLQEYINYDTQFDKTFLEPMKTILNALGWEPERKASLKGLLKRKNG